jgi:hypothetical protein
MSEDVKEKLKEKLEEMKKNRGSGKKPITGKQAGDLLEDKKKLDINMGDRAVKFQNALNEMRQICEMHNLMPEEVNALGNQLQWIAMQVNENQKLNGFQKGLEKQLNNMFAPKEKTFEEKQAEKKAQEAEEGIKRVGPEN